MNSNRFSSGVGFGDRSQNIFLRNLHWVGDEMEDKVSEIDFQLVNLTRSPLKHLQIFVLYISVYATF